MVTLDDIRQVAGALPRTTEAVVRGRIKFRVGSIVYLACARDESVMGVGFPREWRELALAAEPDKFLPPSQADLRYNWLEVRLAAIDQAEMRDLVFDAWSMVVPQRLVDEQLPHFVARAPTPNSR